MALKIQVSHRHQTHHLYPVFLQSSVTNLPIPKLAFDNAEQVLYPRTNARLLAIPLALLATETRPLTTYWCPSRPGHPALRNNFASSLLLRTWLPYDWTPRSEAYFVFPLAQGTPGKQCGLAATFHALHGWQRLLATSVCACHLPSSSSPVHALPACSCRWYNPHHQR